MMNEKAQASSHSSFIIPHSSLFFRSDRDEDGALIAARDEKKHGAVARVLYRRGQVFDRLDGPAVGLLDEVALSKPRLGRRPVGVYARDDEPLPVGRYAEARGHSGRERRHLDSEVAALALLTAALAALAAFAARARGVGGQLPERQLYLLLAPVAKDRERRFGSRLRRRDEVA